ncbi:hypothetical protein Ahy_B06g081737 [Arachis hypogaea]|uniref:Uncharacterized protein n=1 Tax=Arachis hypogaea TaxID=3818 RepID=A0A444YLS5_ARAHY|nr:hypothetical protein Ahy_B06g081737 [Arachis hypogaea]
MQGDDEDSMDEHVGDGVEGLPYFSNEPTREARLDLSSNNRKKKDKKGFEKALKIAEKIRYENTLVVELDVASREEFKLIEHGLERLWDRLSRPKIQEAFEEPGEVVPDLIEKEDVVSFDGSDEAVSASQNGSMLSYDLNRTPEENEYPYSGMSPGKKNAWHLANWETRISTHL